MNAYHATAEAQPSRRTKENLWESMGMAKEDGCMFSGHLESSGCSYAYMAEVVFIQQRHAAVYPAAASCNALHWELLQQQAGCVLRQLWSVLCTPQQQGLPHYRFCLVNQ